MAEGQSIDLSVVTKICGYRIIKSDESKENWFTDKLCS